MPLFSLFSLLLSFVLLSGCAAQHAFPIASATLRTSSPAPTGSGIEVRHMYLFAPGKAPVKIVMRDDGTAVQDEGWSFPAFEP
ncbi:MAG TPA: hypothetical protein VGM44_07385 [Polyangiaceae bacterium]